MNILDNVVNKNVQRYLEELADEVGGKYIEYSNDTVILTLPLNNGRYQNVKGYIIPRGDGIMLEFMSKVCRLSDTENINFEELLSLNHKLCYAKTMIDAGYLEVAASTKYELCTYEQVRYMVFEVARAADELEKKLTGKDIY